MIFLGFWPIGTLLPLDRSDGLGRQVQADTVDAFHFVGDAVGDMVEERVGNFFDGGGHGVLGVDGTDDGGPALVAALVLHAHALDIGHGDEVLPHLAGQAVVGKFFTENGIGFTQGVETVPGDGTQAADTQAGAGDDKKDA